MKTQEESFIRINPEGTKLYYKDKEMKICHRLAGPAVEWSDGSKSWYVDGKLHRLAGPAVELVDGYKSWYVNDKRHRLDGPAIEWSEGSKSWYVDDKYLTEEAFIALTTPKHVELTLDQIAAKFGISVDTLRIVKN